MIRFNIFQPILATKKEEEEEEEAKMDLLIFTKQKINRIKYKESESTLL